MSNIDSATLGQAVHILTLVKQKDRGKKFLTALIGSGLLADLLDATDPSAINRELFRKTIGLGPLVPETVILSVDYSKTLDDMIALGKYDWKNYDLTAKRFSITGEGVQEFEARYFHFNRAISSEDALRLIKEDDGGWEPAKTEHLLVFGANNPDEQRKFPIVALGSVGEVSGDRLVPYLDGDGSRRNLGLYWFDGGWGACCRVLAVRKKVLGK